jgi:O-antigen/teichoic acid export membrane protein
MAVSRQNVFSNMIWRFLERTGAQIVGFIVAIILARILSPEDYGTIALISVFITIMNVFVDSGLGSALVQKKDADNIDFSTVFYTNLFFCLLLYGVMFIVSPFIARFYNNLELTSVIRVLSITILISGIKNIQHAYVSKTLQFRKFFFATLGGTIIAAIVGIWMAYNGFSVWALVAQQLTNLSIDTIILWITVKWRPDLVFSLQRLKKLFSFGWKLLLSALIDTVYSNLRQLIIGKKYSAEDLAFYNKAELFPRTIVGNINSAIDSVLLPAMAIEQDDRERLKKITRRAIKTSTYCIAPLMMGLAACSPAMVSVILTDKWLPCVPYLVIFCITYMFWPIHTANLNAIKAIGRSDLFLKLEIAKKLVGLIVLLSTMWFGVMVMAYSMLFTSVCSQIINAWPNKKLLNYGYLEQLKDILPGIALAVVMGVLVYLFNFLPVAEWIKLVIQIPVGMVIFILGSILFKFESFIYIKDSIKEKLTQRRHSDV